MIYKMSLFGLLMFVMLWTSFFAHTSSSSSGWGGGPVNNQQKHLMGNQTFLTFVMHIVRNSKI